MTEIKSRDKKNMLSAINESETSYFTKVPQKYILIFMRIKLKIKLLKFEHV